MRKEPKTCYCHDSNGYYIGQDSDHGQALPNNATYAAPESKAGFIPHWNGGEREQVENHKGEKGYVNGQHIEIEEYGLLPEGWSITPPPPTLEEAKAAKKSAIDANTNRIRDRDGLAYAGERFDMRDAAMLKWTGLLSAKDILPFPVTILTIDDKPVALADQTALLQFAAAVLSYETDPASPLSIGRELRQRVDAATTPEEVEAIVDDRE